MIEDRERDLTLYGGKDPRHVPIYTLDEAAHILWLPPSTLKAWTMGQKWHEQPSGRLRRFVPLIIPPESNESATLSFTNLIEAHVLQAIRRVHKVKMSKVREAMTELRREFESRHPLAEIDLYTEGKNIIVLYGGYTNMSHGKQMEMNEVISLYLKRVERDEDKLIRFYPFFQEPRVKGPGIEDQPKIISVNPFVSFGRTVIADTNIRTEAIAERFFAGDSIDELSRDFELDKSNIEAAVRFERPRSIAEAAA